MDIARDIAIHGSDIRYYSLYRQLYRHHLDLTWDYPGV